MAKSEKSLRRRCKDTDTLRNFTMQPAIKSGILFDEPLGQILLKKRLITQSQLDVALLVQKHRENEHLDDILKNISLSQDKIRLILKHRDTRKRIGEILVDLGFISPENLESALKLIISFKCY
jgi:hypothetical protein